MSHPLLADEASLSRRRFLAFGGIALAGGVLARTPAIHAAEATTATPDEMMPHAGGKFEVAPLPYAYDALLPSIDEETMHLHHDKHYAAYTKKLNDALDKAPELKSKSLEELLGAVKALPEAVRKVIRNNGGGYYNHSLFWQMMSPNAGGEPGGELAKEIAATFGSFKQFKAAFSEEAATIFGSGWAWLVAVEGGALKLTTTPNQDSPIMKDTVETPGKPILGLDIWEHSYYLKYKNERPKYIEAWWSVVNWKTAEKLFSAARA